MAQYPDIQIRTWVTRLSLALAVAGFVLVIRAAPIELVLQALQTWIAELGPWGPATFALVYAVWSVAFLPGSALTLAGGAIFGIGWGFVAVICGATLGAALSFLIARYLARDKVKQMAQRNPKFGAMDRAIEEGGWKIVAMLRASGAREVHMYCRRDTHRRPQTSGQTPEAQARSLTISAASGRSRVDARPSR